MFVDPRAGEPATPDMLVDVPRLVAAYYEEKPDVSEPTQSVAFGTSGHRGSSLETTFNENHILAISQAICEYRKAQRTDGPLFLAKDTHALSEPAFDSALDVLLANGVEVMVDTELRLHADAGPVARHPQVQPRPQRQICGRHRDYAVAQSAGGWRFQVQPDQRRPGRHHCHQVDRRPRQRHPRWRHERSAAHRLSGGTRLAEHASLRLRLGVRQRPGRDHRLRSDPRGASDAGADPLGGASVAYWGRIAEKYGLSLIEVVDTAGRSHLPLHARGLGRQDPHGLLVAVCDGGADCIARQIPSGLRLRHRCRPARCGRQPGPAQSQPLPRGGDQLPVPQPPRLER